MRFRDLRDWRGLRVRNEEWLRPWEASFEGTWQSRHSMLAAYRLRRDGRVAARERRMMPFVVLHGAALIGQVNLGPIQWGSARSAEIGYWIDRQRAGLGIAPLAVGLVIEHAFGCGLHRVHAAVAPENSASLRVVEKLGMRREGLYERYLDIDGRWRDHIGFALTADEDRSALRAAIS